MKPIRSIATVALLAGLATGAVAASGHAPSAQKPAPHAQLSLEHAVDQVQKQTGGRILAADSIPSGRNKLYRIKVLTPDGHVRVMQLHSNTSGSPDSKSDNKRDKGN